MQTNAPALLRLGKGMQGTLPGAGEVMTVRHATRRMGTKRYVNVR